MNLRASKWVISAIAITGIVTAAAVWQHQSHKQDLVRYENRVFQLELTEKEADSQDRLARLGKSPAGPYKPHLTEAEIAELAELRRRIAVMKADGWGE